MHFIRLEEIYIHEELIDNCLNFNVETLQGLYHNFPQHLNVCLKGLYSDDLWSAESRPFFPSVTVAQDPLRGGTGRWRGGQAGMGQQCFSRQERQNLNLNQSFLQQV